MDTNHDKTNNASQTANEASQRDEQGRFGKGNRGGPGNPYARQTAQLRKAALEAVSEEDVREIMTTLKEKAKSGDVAAAKLLLSYTVGKPAPTPDPDRIDKHELQTISDNHLAQPQQVLDIINGMPIDILLALLHILLPTLKESKTELAKQGLVQSDACESEEVAEEEPSEAESAQMPLSRTSDIPDWMRQSVNEPVASQTSNEANKIVLDNLTQLQAQLSALIEAKNAAVGEHAEKKSCPTANGSNRHNQAASPAQNGKLRSTPHDTPSTKPGAGGELP